MYPTAPANRHPSAVSTRTFEFAWKRQQQRNRLTFVIRRVEKAAGTLTSKHFECLSRKSRLKCERERANPLRSKARGKKNDGFPFSHTTEELHEKISMCMRHSASRQATAHSLNTTFPMLIFKVTASIRLERRFHDLRQAAQNHQSQHKLTHPLVGNLLLSRFSVVCD